MYRQHTKVFIIFDPFGLIKLENVVVAGVVAVVVHVAVTLSVLFIYLLFVICTLIRTHISDIYAFPFAEQIK